MVRTSTSFSNSLSLKPNNFMNILVCAFSLFLVQFLEHNRLVPFLNPKIFYLIEKIESNWSKNQFKNLLAWDHMTAVEPVCAFVCEIYGDNHLLLGYDTAFLSSGSA